MFNRLDRYIIRQVLEPLIMTLGVAAMLLLLERMLRLFDFVVNQGGPVEVVFRMQEQWAKNTHKANTAGANGIEFAVHR